MRIIPVSSTLYPPTAHTEFMGVMSRDIRSYDSEKDIQSAWKVRARRLCGGGTGGDVFRLQRQHYHHQQQQQQQR